MLWNKCRNPQSWFLVRYTCTHIHSTLVNHLQVPYILSPYHNNLIYKISLYMMIPRFSSNMLQILLFFLLEYCPHQAQISEYFESLCSLHVEYSYENALTIFINYISITKQCNICMSTVYCYFECISFTGHITEMFRNILASVQP